MTPSSSTGLIELTRPGSYFGAGRATPTNVGMLCCASDLFCCSTGLFGRANANSARNRPIEQKAKPVKKRGLKKADLEMSFLFIGGFFLLWNVCSSVAQTFAILHSAPQYRLGYTGIRFVTEEENDSSPSAHPLLHHCGIGFLGDSGWSRSTKEASQPPVRAKVGARVRAG